MHKDKRKIYTDLALFFSEERIEVTPCRLHCHCPQQQQCGIWKITVMIAKLSMKSKTGNWRLTFAPSNFVYEKKISQNKSPINKDPLYSIFFLSKFHHFWGAIDWLGRQLIHLFRTAGVGARGTGMAGWKNGLSMFDIIISEEKGLSS